MAALPPAPAQAATAPGPAASSLGARTDAAIAALQKAGSQQQAAKAVTPGPGNPGTVTGANYTQAFGLTKISAHNTTISRGQPWDPSMNFDSAQDSAGHQIPYSSLIHTSDNVDIDAPGDYVVHFSYTDPATKLTASATSTVTVNTTLGTWNQGYNPRINCPAPYYDVSKSVVAKGSFDGYSSSGIGRSQTGAKWALDNHGVLTIQSGTMYGDADISSDYQCIKPLVKTMQIQGPVTADPGDVFSGFPALTAIHGISNLKLAKDVEGISLADDPLLGALDLSKLDTSSITGMGGMFEDDHSLKTLNVSSFNTSKVTDMSSMFSGLGQLTSLDVSSFNTANVTNMRGMFAQDQEGCFGACDGSQGKSQLVSITGLGKFDTSKVTDFSAMFAGADHLQSLDLSHFNMQNATGDCGINIRRRYCTSGMLSGDTSLRELNIGPKTTLLNTDESWDDLPAPAVASDGSLTGMWQSVGTGTKDSPKGASVISSYDISHDYTTTDNGETYGKASFPVGDYVWQRSHGTARDASPASVLASGRMGSGTSTWKLTADGTLRISGGTIAYAIRDDSSMSGQSNPLWAGYTDKIRNIVVDAPVSFAGDMGNVPIPTFDSDRYLGLAKADIDFISNLSDLAAPLAPGSKKELDYAGTIQGATASSLFANLTGLESIQNLDMMDFSNVTDFSYMFKGDYALRSASFGGRLSNSYALVAEGMFAGSGVESVSGLNFGKQQPFDLNGMFAGASVRRLDLSGIDFAATGRPIPDKYNLYAFSDGRSQSLSSAFFGTVKDAAGADGPVSAASVIWKAAAGAGLDAMAGFFGPQQQSASPVLSYLGKTTTEQIAGAYITNLNNKAKQYQQQLSDLQRSGNGSADQLKHLADLVDAAHSDASAFQSFSDESNWKPVYGNGASNMLNANSIQQLTLGSTDNLSNTGLPALPTGIRAVGDYVDGAYDWVVPGKWQSVGSGTALRPAGSQVTDSNGLMALYSGHAAGTQTFVPQGVRDQSLVSLNTTIPANSAWHLNDNLASDGGTPLATAGGTAIDPSNLNVSPSVDASVPFTNTLEYSTSNAGWYGAVGAISSPATAKVQGNGTYVTADGKTHTDLRWGQNSSGCGQSICDAAGTFGQHGVVTASCADDACSSLSGSYANGADNGTLSGTLDPGHTALHLVFMPYAVQAKDLSFEPSQVDPGTVLSSASFSGDNGSDLSYAFLGSADDVWYSIGAYRVQAGVYDSKGAQVSKLDGGPGSWSFSDTKFASVPGSYQVRYTVYVRNADVGIATISRSAKLSIGKAKPQQVVVSFDTNGGAAIASREVDAGGTLPDPPTPTKPGYDFAGWYTDAALKHAFDPHAAINAETTLHAKWKAVAKPTTPTTGDKSATTNPGTPVTLNPVTVPGSGNITKVAFDNGQPTKTVPGEGSWTIMLNNGQPVATFTPLKDYDGKVTPQQYTVTDSNGKSAAGTLNVVINMRPPAKVATVLSAGGSSDATANSATVSATLKDSYARPVAGAPVTFTTADGKISASAKTNASGIAKTTLAGLKASAKYAVGVSYAGDSARSASTLNTPITFTTKPAPKPVPVYAISFDANGGKFSNGSATQQASVKQGAKYTLAAAPVRSGYTFSGWFTAKSGGSKVTGTPVATGSRTLYAQWKTVPPAKLATSFSAAGSSSVTVNGASVSATLKDSAGKPVTGAGVVFATADGRTSVSVKTDASGVAKAALAGLKAATKYSVGAKYAGDATHSASALGSPISFTTKVAPKPTSKPALGAPVAVYRVYNQNSGLHHYTTSVKERDALVKLGWKNEGTSFQAAKPGSANGLRPVYREYNPHDGNHNWTLNQAEHKQLVKLGWKDEGTAWYTNPAGPVTVYRLYNPHSGEHVYTTSAKEYAAVGKAGWHQEGTAWKGL
jgi:uncharacterized repeat protein (TIGR02543 family)